MSWPHFIVAPAWTLLLICVGSCNTGEKVTSTPLATTTSLARSSKPPYAVNYPWWARMDDASSRMMTKKAADAGFGWIRLYLPWGLIERTQSSFDWGDYGRAIDNAHAAGLAVEAVLVHPTPCWAAASCLRRTSDGTLVVRCAERDNGCRPTSPRHFQRFAHAAARRFGDHVAAWALWQEPNAPEPYLID
jgi:hypothetical protein